MGIVMFRKKYVEEKILHSSDVLIDIKNLPAGSYINQGEAGSLYCERLFH